MYPMSMPPGTDRRGPARVSARIPCELRSLGASSGATAVLSEGSSTGLYIHTAHPAESGEWVAVHLPNNLVVDGQVVRRERGSRPGVAIVLRHASRAGAPLATSLVMDTLRGAS